MSEIEKLLDENNDENLVLYDENDNAVEFEQVAVIPYCEKVYAILSPVQKIEGVADDEAFVFVIEEIDDEECIVMVQDNEIIDAVFVEYYKLLDESNNGNN